ncbi:MAG TPA: potassium-transporting ATPase subunit KdpA [Xanthobacteraceae bacterium]|nr:potassium-transporting ATPase subunit KdpA [Xanthobacteraceae bacterium]
MTTTGWLEILLFVAVVGSLTRPLGGYLQRVYSGERTLLRPLLASIESALYRLAGVKPDVEQDWLQYAISFLIFHALGIVALYGLLRAQSALPLNPLNLPAVAPDLALNTAVSFTTNTSWQSYAGETTLSYFSQMTGITVQSFLSVAAGMAVAVALIRGFARRRSATVGNFWVDLTRGTLYVLLPICIVAALLLIAAGIPQTLSPAAAATTLEGALQMIARGPVASQEAIKLLSGDGGGFFNANSAHPFENPTSLTNLIEVLLIFALGAALTNCFGRMVGSERHGWILLCVMAILFGLGVGGLYAVEAGGNPALAALHPDRPADLRQPAGNMEGKEVRFGIAGSALFAEVSTASSDGAVNSMHDSFLPLSGGILLANMMVDEVIVGAPGSGLYGMLLFCIVAVFIAGLMIGRTPEYVGKKIGSTEIKMTILALICVPAAALGLAAVACILEPGLAGLGNAGPHGFSEVLYAYTSAAATNGSAFAGLNSNSPFYNLTLALAMFVGRFLVIVPVLAVAGSLAAQPITPRSSGTLPTDRALFVFLLVGVIVIVGGLSFLPVLALGPLIEQLQLLSLTLY